MAENFAGLRLLVVDDMFSSRRVTVKLCSRIGFTDIAQAESGAEAITALNGGNAFDAALMDLNLGDMTALDILQQVRAARPDLKTKFVIMTSDAEGDMIERLTAAGMAGYLLKPLDVETLEEKFQAVLGC